MSIWFSQCESDVQLSIWANHQFLIWIISTFLIWISSMWIANKYIFEVVIWCESVIWTVVWLSIWMTSSFCNMDTPLVMICYFSMWKHPTKNLLCQHNILSNMFNYIVPTYIISKMHINLRDLAVNCTWLLTSLPPWV